MSPAALTLLTKEWPIFVIGPDAHNLTNAIAWTVPRISASDVGLMTALADGGLL
jgi:hypothetical protein